MAIIIILSVIILILLFILVNYQRQVKDICRQLSFLKDHDTNLIITSDTDTGGLGELKDNINDVLKENRLRHKSYIEKEKNLADTYTNLSHDIRTPLTSLDGYFELLSECETEEDKQRYINIIKERIESLNNMLEELFTFTKLKNESFEINMSRLSLNKLVKEILLSYYEDWIAKDIEPIININDAPIYINGNEQALKRVIQNIIKNVLEHGEGEIRISLSKLDGIAALVISNQVANPEDIDINRVFERFYKADDARSRTSTGLGLSIAYGFVQKMNGNIRAELDGNIFSIIVEFSIDNTIS